MAIFHYNNLSKSSGVYVIFNSLNWRIYVGSTKRFQERWNAGHHKSLLKGKHQNKFLQADYNKCKALVGHDDFLGFYVLENMPGSTREERLAAEQRWIDIHFDKGEQCYNLCDRAISREGFALKNPQETSKKLSAASKRRWANTTPEDKQRQLNDLKAFRTKETYEKVSKALSGRNLLESTKEKISKSQTGKQLSQTHKDNIGKGCKGKPATNARKIEQYSLDGVLMKIWPSITKAGRNCGISSYAIDRCLAGNSKTSGGFVWKYAN